MRRRAQAPGDGAEAAAAAAARAEVACVWNVTRKIPRGDGRKRDGARAAAGIGSDGAELPAVVAGFEPGPLAPPAPRPPSTAARQSPG